MRTSSTLDGRLRAHLLMAAGMGTAESGKCTTSGESGMGTAGGSFEDEAMSGATLPRGVGRRFHLGWGAATSAYMDLV